MFGKNVFVGNDNLMQGLIARLDRLTKSEDLLIGVETLNLSKRTERTVETVHVSVQDQSLQLRKMSVGVNQLLDAAQTAEKEVQVEKGNRHLEVVKNMLEPSSLPQDHFYGIKRERLPDSGDWIWKEGQMQAWLASKTPLIWISGNSGSGKSFLVYNIVSRLEAIHQDASAGPFRGSIGYFFFCDNQHETRSFEKALRNVAYQISQTNPAYVMYVERLSRTSPAVSSVESAWRKLFIDFFTSRDLQESPTFVILDGIDESYQEDRNTFFTLLNDIHDADKARNLHIAIIGQPQIGEEMEQGLERSVSTIHVDRVKTGSDIVRDVELSISKSKVLSRVSKDLKKTIIRTLSAKAEGMFLWVKLMIAELGKKSRESAIRESLNKAPKGLTKMLRHILETFSAVLTEEDAVDLNNMLAWVALAKRPLTLGELSEMLRLQSPEGDPVLFLEGKLRKQFASFFTLVREDNLSTAELMAHMDHIDGENDTLSSRDFAEGLDDVENETDFNSNPNTTTVEFCHSSISNFFRNPEQGKVKAIGAECPLLGVDLREARFAVAYTCVDLIANCGEPDEMQEDGVLRIYAASYWKQHLDEIDAVLEPVQKVDIGLRIARMMRDQSSLEYWCKESKNSFFSAKIAEQILLWICVPEVLEKLSNEARSWYLFIKDRPLELFDAAIKCVYDTWMDPEILNLDMKPLVFMIAA